MRGIRLDNGGTYLVNNSHGNTFHYGLVHIDRPMGLARASYTPDAQGGILGGYTITLEIARRGTQTGIVVATMVNVSPLLNFQPYGFDLPEPQTNHVMLQAQDELVLHVAQSSSSTGNLPNGFLRLDLFARR